MFFLDLGLKQSQSRYLLEISHLLVILLVFSLFSWWLINPFRSLSNCDCLFLFLLSFDVSLLIVWWFCDVGFLELLVLIEKIWSLWCFWSDFMVVVVILICFDDLLIFYVLDLQSWCTYMMWYDLIWYACVSLCVYCLMCSCRLLQKDLLLLAGIVVYLLLCYILACTFVNFSEKKSIFKRRHVFFPFRVIIFVLNGNERSTVLWSFSVCVCVSLCVRVHCYWLMIYMLKVFLCW